MIKDRLRALGLLALASLVAGCGADPDPEAEAEAGAPPLGPVTFIEHHPGDLVITSPSRAAFFSRIDGEQITVTGTGATSSLTINDQDVDPEPDGSFATTVTASEGLNLIRAVDGERSSDTAFVFGDFEPADMAVPAAVAVRINETGFDDASDEVVSLTLLAQAALDDNDLLAPLQGQVFTGDIPGGDWEFVVKSARYDGAGVHLAPRAGGARFDADMSDIQVDGELTIKVIWSKTDDVSLTADAARVGGNIEAGLEGDAIVASASGVETSLENFQYDSGNAGFPCCVDGIMTDYLRPKIAKAVQDKVKGLLSQELAFALGQFSLPESVDLAAAGFDARIEVDQRFDGVEFDAAGGQITAAVHFRQDIAPSDPGAAAPGWLTVSDAPGDLQTAPSFGISVSVDALNQALFAAWAQDGLRRTLEDLPMAGTVQIAPQLMPLVLPNDHGGLTAGAGEIVIDAVISNVPVRAAITIIDDIDVALDPAAGTLVLTPAPEATISITWLQAEGLADSMRQLIKNLLVDKLPSLLTPISLPLPRVALAAVAGSFGDSVATLAPGSSLSFAAGRAQLYGDLAILAAPPP